MCGRFTLFHSLEQIIERFEIANANELSLSASYNIAPTEHVLTVINDGKNNRAGFLRWGLIPSWSKDPSIGNKMINARAESIDTKPSFKPLLANKRCLIIADGFYEWRKEGSTKQPYYITLKNGGLFAFAGLWTKWQQAEKQVNSCTIITTEPNDLMSELHSRMPVILPTDKEAKWLNRSETNPSSLKEYLIPYNSQEMTAYPVSTKVNSAKNNSPDCIEEIN
ncbi:SOS response-associated peptidase [Bacillus tianshenii]|nr:SOS response-associated peptidase [Bacillus tianshenii]